MNLRGNREFLLDLAVLLRRHGPEPFLSLVATITNSEKRDELVRGLTELAEVAKKTQATKRLRKSRKISDSERAHSLIEQVRQSDSQRAQILSELYEALWARELLPSKGEVLDLCFDLHIEVPSSAPRSRLLLTIIRHLTKLPDEEAQAAIQQALKSSGEPARKYERLANVIMKSKSA